MPKIELSKVIKYLKERIEYHNNLLQYLKRDGYTNVIRQEIVKELETNLEHFKEMSKDEYNKEG